MLTSTLSRSAAAALIALSLPALARAVPEARWQVAWNQVRFGGAGQLEVSVPGGRVDILTGEWAIEVDHVYKYREGIRQSRHYARETGRKAGLALFMDSPTDTPELAAYARKVAELMKIRVWVINDDLDPATTFLDPPRAEADTAATVWVNPTSGVYHLP